MKIARSRREAFVMSLIVHPTLSQGRERMGHPARAEDDRRLGPKPSDYLDSDFAIYLLLCWRSLKGAEHERIHRHDWA
jgi:hypothetical protein